MTRSVTAAGCVVFLVNLVYSVPVAAQCCESCSDYCVSRGWLRSPSRAACGWLCENCRKNCFFVAAPTAVSKHPGALVDFRHGRLVVSEVLPDSGAAMAGLRTGDEIVTINGKQPGEGCAGDLWASPADGEFAFVTVSRQPGGLRAVRIALQPLDRLLLHAEVRKQREADAVARPWDGQRGAEIFRRLRSVVTHNGELHAFRQTPPTR